MQFNIRMNWLRRFGWWLNDLIPRWPQGWFAWRPVKLDNGRWAWLERVERDRKSHFYSYDNMFGGKSHNYYTTVTYRSKK